MLKWVDNRDVGIKTRQFSCMYNRAIYIQSLANLVSLGHNMAYILLFCACPTRQKSPYCVQLEPSWPNSVYRWLWCRGIWLTLSDGHDGLYPLSISSDLGLKGLMFLMLALDVAWIEVRFIGSDLDLFWDPCFYFISISAELLQGVGFTKLGTLLN